MMRVAVAGFLLGCALHAHAARVTDDTWEEADVTAVPNLGASASSRQTGADKLPTVCQQQVGSGDVQYKIVYKQTLNNSVLSQHLADAGQQVLDELLWPAATKLDPNNTWGLDNKIGDEDPPVETAATQVLFLDTDCDFDNGALRSNHFLMRLRANGSSPVDFTFKVRGEEDQVKDTCLGLNPVIPADAHIDIQTLLNVSENRLKIKKQKIPQADGTLATKLAKYNSFKYAHHSGVVHYASQILDPKPLSAWAQAFPVLQQITTGNATVAQHDVKTVRAAYQREINLGGKAHIGGKKVEFAVVVWRLGGEVVGGELTWDVKCKHGFDDAECKTAEAANDELFKRLHSSGHRLLGTGSKTGLLSALDEQFGHDKMSACFFG